MAYSRTPRSVPALVRSGTGEPVVLLHPFATSHHVWTAVIERLAGEHDVLAPTLAGHWGGPVSRKISITTLADAVEQAMDEAGWDSAHIVGNSLGGWISFELERRGRARSVIAIAPAGGWKHWSWMEIVLGLRFLSYLPAIAVGRLLGELVFTPRLIQQQVLRALVHQPGAVEQAATLNLLRAATQCPAYLPMILAGLRDGGITGLDAVRAPVLLALCAQDRFIPPRRFGTMFVENLPPHTEHVLLPDVGHIPELENPELVADTISAFVAKHGTRREISA